MLNPETQFRPEQFYTAQEIAKDLFDYLDGSGYETLVPVKAVEDVLPLLTASICQYYVNGVYGTNDDEDIDEQIAQLQFNALIYMGVLPLDDESEDDE